MRSVARRRIPNFLIGLFFVGLVVVGFYLAFNKGIFSSYDYKLKAVFRNAQNLLPNSPVRIAGVNVGRVTEVEPLGPSPYGAGGVLVTMEISEQGKPIHSDARLQLRPRLFLGGNLFIDLDPGSPSAPEMESGATFDVEQTHNSVQVDEILTALQADVRGNLQLLLAELGTALQRGGAEGLRSFFAESYPAFRYGPPAIEGLLGTEPRDLSRLVRNLGRLAAALNSDPPALAGLIRNLTTVTGSLAAQDEALAASIEELPLLIDAAGPAFTALNDSLPYARALAIESLPGVRAAGPALEASLPLVVQLQQLLTDEELGGLARALSAMTPPLARLSAELPSFLEQARALSGCFNEVVIPWSNMSVPDPVEPATGDVYQELAYGLVGIGGISRNSDANGAYARTGPSGGSNSVIVPPLGARPDVSAGVTPFSIDGTLPSLQSSAQTHYRPGVPCETQEPPNLASQVGDPPAQRSLAGVAGEGIPSSLRGIARSYAATTMALRDLVGESAGTLARRPSRELLQLGSQLDRIRDRYLEQLVPLGLDYLEELP